MKIKHSLLTAALFTLPALSFATEAVSPGVKLYQAACSNCHAPEKAKAMKAPAAFNAVAWKKRYENASKEVIERFRFKSIDDYFLYQVTIGKGLMHHGGLCEESKVTHPTLKCDEKTYLEAIHYMSHAKPKSMKGS